jgi:DNA-binding response OmpR family regulator
MEWLVQKVVRPAKNTRILLIEDEPDIRVLLHNVLFAAGYSVHSAGTMAGALALLETHHYHLILTDDQLPDGRGVDIADRARARGMDAVVITGFGTRISKAEVERHEVLLKPVRPDELVEAVDRHTGKSRPLKDEP